MGRTSTSSSSSSSSSDDNVLPKSTVAKKVPRRVNGARALKLLTEAAKDKSPQQKAGKAGNPRPSSTPAPAAKKAKETVATGESFNITSDVLGQLMLWFTATFKLKMQIPDLQANLEQFGIPVITEEMTYSIEELAKKVDYRSTPNFNYWQIFTHGQQLYYNHHKRWPGTEVNGIISSLINIKFRNKFNNWRQKDVTLTSFADFREEYDNIFPSSVALASGQSVQDACEKIEWFLVHRDHQEEWEWIQDVIKQLPKLPGVEADPDQQQQPIPPYIYSMEESVRFYREMAECEQEEAESGDEPTSN
jgi:hypothetical protein